MLVMWLCQLDRELTVWKNFIAALLVGTGLQGFVAKPTSWPRDMMPIPTFWGHRLIKYCTA